MSINSIGSNIPIQVAKGGIGTNTLTQYGVLYGNGTSAVQATAVGTATNVLTSNGAGMAPSFQPIGSVPGGGAWALIQTQVASNSPSLVFNTGLSSYQTLVFIVSGILSTVLADICTMQVSLDGGVTWPGFGSGSQGGPALYVIVSGANAWTNTPNSFTNIALSSQTMATTGSGLSGTYFYYGANVNVDYQRLRGEWGMFDSNGNTPFGIAQGYNQAGSVTTVNAFRIIMGTGNILSGSVSLYGLVN